MSRSRLLQEGLARTSRGLLRFSTPTGVFFKTTLRLPLAMEIAYRVGANRVLCPRHYIEALFRHVRGMGFQVVLRGFESMVRHSAKDVLSRIDVPTFIVGGELDGMTPPERSEEMHRAIPGSECKVYTECTHLAMIEKHGEVMADMDSFLDRHRLTPVEKKARPRKKGAKTVAKSGAKARSKGGTKPRARAGATKKTARR